MKAKLNKKYIFLKARYHGKEIILNKLNKRARRHHATHKF